MPKSLIRHGSLLSLALMSACAPARAATPVASAAPFATRAEAAPAPDTGTVVVTASARIDVPVDRARARFAVETEAKTAAEAVAANAARMASALEAMRAALGGAGTLETSGYSLNPVYAQPPRGSGGQPTIAGYRALNYLEVTVEDVDLVGGVLDAAVEAGINRVADLSFYAEDTREAHLAALREATARAREEAQVLADALGVPLGSPLRVTSSSQSPGPRRELMRSFDAAAVATPIEGGDQTVTASVTITYRLGGGADR